MQPFAAAYVNYIRIRESDRHCSDRAGRLLVEDWCPGTAIVGRLPHAAVAYAHIKDVGLVGHTGDGLGASATEGANRPPVEGLKEVRAELLLRQHGRGGSNQDHIRETTLEQGHSSSKSSSQHLAISIQPIKQQLANSNWPKKLRLAI